MGRSRGTSELERISKSHPRKGTETSTMFNSNAAMIAISKPHPRKGTETRSQKEWSETFPLFQTTSPQGDGNNSREFLTTLAMISKPHPRKGTETTRGACPLFFCFFRVIVTSATESRSILIYTGLIDDRCFQTYRSE